MAIQWQVVVTPLDDAQQVGLGFWEPFQVVEDDDGKKLIVCKRQIWVEDDEPRSSAKRSNRQLVVEE